jgi:hypothetical protein
MHSTLRIRFLDAIQFFGLRDYVFPQSQPSVFTLREQCRLYDGHLDQDGTAVSRILLQITF